MQELADELDSIRESHGNSITELAKLANRQAELIHELAQRVEALESAAKKTDIPEWIYPPDAKRQRQFTSLYGGIIRQVQDVKTGALYILPRGFQLLEYIGSTHESAEFRYGQEICIDGKLVLRVVSEME